MLVQHFVVIYRLMLQCGNHIGFAGIGIHQQDIRLNPNKRLHGRDGKNSGNGNQGGSTGYSPGDFFPFFDIVDFRLLKVGGSLDKFVAFFIRGFGFFFFVRNSSLLSCFFSAK